MFGSPAASGRVWDEDSELISSATEMEPMTDDREAALDNYARYGPPRPDWQPTVLVHHVRASADGWARTAFVNRRLGLGVRSCRFCGSGSSSDAARTSQTTGRVRLCSS